MHDTFRCVEEWFCKINIRVLTHKLLLNFSFRYYVCNLLFLGVVKNDDGDKCFVLLVYSTCIFINSHVFVMRTTKNFSMIFLELVFFFFLQFFRLEMFYVNLNFMSLEQS